MTQLWLCGVPQGCSAAPPTAPGSEDRRGALLGRHWLFLDRAMPGEPPPPPGPHLHKSQHHKSRPDTRPWKQTDKKVVGTLERWGRPAPVSAEEGGGRVPALPTGPAF